jgi:putative membrane protein
MMHSGMGFGGHGYLGTLGPIVFIITLALIGVGVYYILKKGGKELRDKEILLIVGLAVLLLFGFGSGMMTGLLMGPGLLIWAVILFLVYYMFVDKKRVVGEESAMDVLDKRFAKGEISREEYLEMKKEIMRT